MEGKEKAADENRTSDVVVECGSSDEESGPVIRAGLHLDPIRDPDPNATK